MSEEPCAVNSLCKQAGRIHSLQEKEVGGEGKEKKKKTNGLLVQKSVSSVVSRGSGTP